MRTSKHVTMTTLMRGALVASVTLTLWPVLLDAVLVAPHALFIDARSRMGEVYLINQSNAPEEARIAFEYGYPTTDSLGNVYIMLDSVPGPGAHPATPWLHAYPRRVRVEPGQRQLVRVIADPPADLPDGEYWSRLLVTSHEVGKQVTVATNDSTVRAGLVLQLRTITSVTFRKGAVHTEVHLTDFRSAVANDSLITWVGLDRGGNAAFLGSVAISLDDADAHTVRTWTTPIAVYDAIDRRFAVPLDSVPVGKYTVHLNVSTARQDIDRRYILPADSIARTVGIEIR